MNKRKIIFLSATTTLVVASSLSIAIPVGLSITNQNKIDYDLGLVSTPINSLNYVKYRDINSVIPSMVEGIVKPGPDAKLKEQLSLPNIQMGVYSFNKDNLNKFSKIEKENARESGIVYPLDLFGYTTGSALAKTSDVNTLTAITDTRTERTYGFKARLNQGQSKWSNGDPVLAQDFIDMATYILDINIGSQHLVDFLNLNIKNSQKIIDTQEQYVKKFGEAYINPFARVPYIYDKAADTYKEDPDFIPWNSQIAGDNEYVEAIKEAVLGFGMYTGQAFEEFDNEYVYSRYRETPGYVVDLNEVINIPNPEYDYFKSDLEQENIPKYIEKPLIRNRFFDWKNQVFDASKSPLAAYEMFAQNKYDLFFEFEPNSPIRIFDFLQRIQTSSFLLPVNRKFIETKAGGIEKFGTTKERFLWNGPFNLGDIFFGANGYMNLEKNPAYYSSEKTIANKIKVYFQTDPTVSIAMFEGGYVAQSLLPSIHQISFWSDPEYKKLMRKNTGFGTIAMQMNLDETKLKERGSYLSDPNLRNAISYAINRNNVLRLVGWQSSFPVITWTAFNQAVSSKGIPIESVFEKQRYSTKNNIEFPIQNHSFVDHSAKNFNFEKLDRTDKGFNLETARYYLEEFKKSHPDLKVVNLQFIHNSTAEQLNAAIAIKDEIDRAFGGYVQINIKGYPANVYEDFRLQGNFDLTYYNFDSFGRSAEGYIKAFLFEDGIDPENGKTVGYRLNPSGGWTYKKYFDSIDLDVFEEEKKRLQIDDVIWNKMIDLSTKRLEESEVEHKERVNKFFALQFTDSEILDSWNELKVFLLVAGFEKIVRDAAPIIPLMEVDTNWIISRLGGLRNTSFLSLQFAYDLKRPPRINLPTEIEN